MRTFILFFLLLAMNIFSYSQENNMVLITEGQCKLKSGKSVIIKSFYMSKYEVTIAEFERFVKTTKYVTDAEKKGFSIFINDTVFNANWKCDSKGKPRLRKNYDYPVMHVSYNDAIAYVKWKKYRLPTEEEWIYVASQKYPGKIKEKVCFRDNTDNAKGYLDAQPTGSKKANIWGIYDLLGNMNEMTSTRITEYGGGYIAKGGCFWYWKEDFYGDKPIYRELIVRDLDYTSECIGFRCVKDFN
jgi:formylglycine-generating enzyme required for sulfatase activity